MVEPEDNQWPDVSRREFLQMMAGGGAAYAMGGDAIFEKLTPEVKGPRTMRPGLWTQFATTCRECPAGCGMHMRCQDNRAVKAEGNPAHPVSGGGLCPRGQSSVQGQYDPDRLDHFLRADEKREMCDCKWPDFIEQVAAQAKKAQRIVIVSDAHRGALSEVMEEFVRSCGRPTELLCCEAFNHEAMRKASSRLLGLDTIPRYRFDQCDAVLSFGADFMESWVSSVEYARQFSMMHHRGEGAGGQMIYIGPKMSMTAASADELYKVRPSEMTAIALATLNAMLQGGWARKSDQRIAGLVEGFTPEKAAKGELTAEKIRALARRFGTGKRSVAIAGSGVSAGREAEELAMAAMLLNYCAGSIGTAVDFSGQHAIGRAAYREKVASVLGSLGKGDMVIFHNTNPAFTMPETAGFIGRASYSVYIGTMIDETAEKCFWKLPIDGPLESWGDHEPWRGTYCLLQPTMARLYDTRNSGDILMSISKAMGRPLTRKGQPATDFLAWLRLRWKELGQGMSPDRTPDGFWRDSLKRGFVESKPVTAPTPALNLEGVSFSQAVGSGRPELWLWPSVSLHDGRVANRGWLQEMPDPISAIAWQSWLDVAPEMGKTFGVVDGDIVKVTVDGHIVELPVRVSQDVAEGVAAMALGWGHTAMGDIARGAGVNGFELGGASAGVVLSKSGGHKELLHLTATRQQHERDVLQWATFEDVAAGPAKEEITWPLPRGYDNRRDLYPPHEHKNNRWAMVVDLDRCVGCGACSVACYAENNIHVVGPDRAGLGRVMPWLRVVPYEDQHEAGRLGFLPMMCHHCDAAPCEPVCPVYASIHNEDGLNAQVYNRCIGTRYCSNNCPYKVRRFNWFDYELKKPLDMQLNPDVTVRRRGVMEKCTFCVQRIVYARHQATLEGRKLRDGEVMPACVQSCPTRTFVFGDLMDPKSEVSRLFEHERRYQVLRELNTKPAVVYLKRLKPGGRGTGRQT
jgi:Fe-S-cluster-containing dehydrogenase component/anaerobic selenocysteine-containing dehydrogenase